MLRALVDAGIEFVLVGGMAAIVHGAPRVTLDLDITPDPSEDNLERLSKALKLDARIRAPDVERGLPFAHDARSLARAEIWNLRTLAGNLDLLFVPAGTAGFDELRRGAVTAEIAGFAVNVASVDDLIRMKSAAGRPKDIEDIKALRAVLRERER